MPAIYVDQAIAKAAIEEYHLPGLPSLYIIDRVGTIKCETPGIQPVNEVAKRVRQ